MTDKKLSEFEQVNPADLKYLVVLFLDETQSVKNAITDWATLNALLVHKAGTETITGDKTFSGAVVVSGSATFNNGVNGTCSRATADGSGNEITTTYATKTELQNAKTTITYWE